MRIERDLLALRGDLTRGKVEALEIRDPPAPLTTRSASIARSDPASS